jgi:hypothetical protein
MSTEGLLFQLDAKPGTEDELAAAFDVEVPAALDELPVFFWAALRFAPVTFGVLATFDLRTGQEAHIGDRIAEALRESTTDLLERPPLVRGFDIIASGTHASTPSH